MSYTVTNRYTLAIGLLLGCISLIKLILLNYSYAHYTTINGIHIENKEMITYI